jgi:hypothetical protein
MKIFFFMGRNPKNNSGISWKIWKIERRGRIIRRWWGRAQIVDRRVQPAGKLQPHSKTFGSVEAAAVFEQKLIDSKLRGGYERNTRWRQVR